jgi:hypothetical protein
MVRFGESYFAGSLCETLRLLLFELCLHDW